MRHDQAHPPTPAGATSRELQAIQHLHRAATTTDDEASRPAMLAGVDLIVELIRARDRRQTFNDQWDHSQAEG